MRIQLPPRLFPGSASKLRKVEVAAFADEESPTISSCTSHRFLSCSRSRSLRAASPIDRYDRCDLSVELPTPHTRTTADVAPGRTEPASPPVATTHRPAPQASRAQFPAASHR